MRFEAATVERRRNPLVAVIVFPFRVVGWIAEACIALVMLGSYVVLALCSILIVGFFVAAAVMVVLSVAGVL